MRFSTNLLAISLVAILAALDSASACLPPLVDMSTPNADGTMPPTIVGSAWRVAAIDGQEMPDGPYQFVEFGFDGMMRGTSACRSFQAPYSTRDGSLSLGTVLATLEECGAAAGGLDRPLLAALPDAVGYDLSEDGGSLTLATRDGREIALTRVIER